MGHGGGHPQGREIIMHGQVQTFNPAPQVPFAHPVVEVTHSRMPGRIICSENLQGLLPLVRTPYGLHVEYGQEKSLLIPKSHNSSGFALFSKTRGNIQGDGHGPEHAVCKAHGGKNRLVILLTQIPFQRIKSPVEEKFQITELTGAQINERAGQDPCLEMLGPSQMDQK
jgi:hypothetical protein